MDGTGDEASAGEELFPNELLDGAGGPAPKTGILDGGAEEMPLGLPSGMGPDDPKLKDGPLGPLGFGAADENPGALFVVEFPIVEPVEANIGVPDEALPNGFADAV